MIKIGSKPINKIYLGETDIIKLYLGTELVFDNTTPVVGLKPIMTNFRVEDTHVDRIYFDTPLGPVTGVDYTTFVIDGVTITGINTVDNYLTTSANLNYFSQILIRKEGGDNSVTYDFLVQRITNNIAEPTPTAIRYASNAGSGSKTGVDEANAWDVTQIAANVSPGMKVMMIAEDYTSYLSLGGSDGTIANPIWLEGYNNDAKDVERTRTYGMTFDNTIMPLFDGHGIKVNKRDYYILKNLQFENPAETYGVEIARAFGTRVENCYFKEGGYGIYNFDAVLGSNSKIIRCYSQDVYQSGFRLRNGNNLIQDTWSVTTLQTLNSGTDYYISINGGEVGTNNAVLDCYVRRFPTMSHNGHGISLKANQDATDPDSTIEHALVENNNVIDNRGGVEFRHSQVRYCVARNNIIEGINEPVKVIGTHFRDGASYNTFENNIVKNGNMGVRFHNSGEDASTDGAKGGFENTVRNNVFDTMLNFVTADSGTSSNDNNFYHNTILNVDDITNVTTTFTRNIFKNNIVQGGLTTDNSGTWSNTVFWDNSFASYGTNIEEVNPDLDANYEPQATFSTIQFGRITDIFYDKDGNERADLTTAGSVNSADEAVVENTGLKPIMTNFKITNAYQTDVNFETPLGYPDGILASDFTVQGKTVSSVTKINETSGYFTLSAPLTYYDNILIRKEAGNSTGCHDFTLQYIQNNIDQPTASTIRYVSDSGSGDGTSEGSAASLSYCMSNASAGQTWYIKQGTYSGTFNLSSSGTVGSPIKLVGYKTSIGDGSSYMPTRSQSLNPNAAELPRINGSLNISSRKYIIAENIQVDGGTNCFDLNSFQHISNCYAFTGQFGFIANANGHQQIRLTDCYSRDMTNSGVRLYNKSHLYDNFYSCTSGAVSMDYYISMYGGTDGHSQCVINSTVDRNINATHTGHGIGMKGSGGILEHSLVENSTVNNCGNGGLEYRHSTIKHNIGRNITIDSDTKGVNNRAIMFRDGTSFNRVENSHVNNAEYSVRFLDSTEDGGLNQNGGSDNTVINTIFSNADTSFINVDGGVTLPNERNKFINCTFDNAPDFYKSGTTPDYFDSSNEFINCIVNDCNDKIGSGQGSFIFVDSLFYGGFAGEGTGAITGVDPLLNASYQPQATFTSIDVARSNEVYYDSNGDERSNPTTVGGVKHNDEIIVPDLMAPELLTATVEDANPNDVVMVFDESVSGTNLGFAIAGTTSSAFSSLSGSGTTWTGVLADAVVFGETITLSYSESTGDFVDSSGNALEDITNRSVTNNVAEVVSPKYVFDGTSTAHFVTDSTTFRNGIVAQSWVVKGKFSGSGINQTFVGQETSSVNLRFGATAGDDLRFRLKTSNVVGSSIDSDEHIYIATYDGTFMKIYVDGVNVASANDGDFVSSIDGKATAFGTANGLDLDGEMSDIQFYNKALSQSEIDDLQIDLTDTASGLVANFAGQKTVNTWTDEVSGLTAQNQGGVTLV